MKTSKIVIYESNEDFFKKIKQVCDELTLVSFPLSFEDYKSFESDLKNFIGEPGQYNILYIIEYDFVSETFYRQSVRGQKTIFLFDITRKKKFYLEQLEDWCETNPECSFIETRPGSFTTSLLYTIRNRLKAKRGNFTLNSERSRVPTNDSMYDCDDCLKNNIEHRIITIPGPPAEALTQSAYKGEATTLRECTGCEAQDGPWVPAQI